ncbi:DUF3131 domain-containing protein [filamentous cyanobacterium LEGE 11480]|uniref:DUF3131 domain-containing protein n=1 Tax=Romeriopsis navalis LEGE 11480 TaxID=2777977 RepID=A0A928VLF6_9CYAN|nr:DUF3131 domain-containing protein [Romeriopsis navalis]MBE9029802.1 DUF3131 domain-containing protein [Romeriopsis navalis LEGE 11480]
MTLPLFFLLAQVATPLPHHLPHPEALPQPSLEPPAGYSLSRLSVADRAAAKIAWKYFERNWDQRTGLVHSVDRLPWTTVWDQGSALLGIHAARQLGLMTADRFQQRITTTLGTLETLPLPPSGLPHKAYDTQTVRMLDLDMRPDPTGSSGYSALDVARLLGALHILRTHYPMLKPQIERIVARWNLEQLVQDGQLYGLSRDRRGRLQRVQEGRSGYEQYAAYMLQLWDLDAAKALRNPAVDWIEIEGDMLEVDQRNLTNSGASNYLTSDPYLLLAMEVGLPQSLQPQVDTLLGVQEKRFQRTQILTAVNEDSLDRFPYFLYYNVYANDQIWQPITAQGKAYPHLRFLSTKAAFAWHALKPQHPYTQRLRQAVQPLGDAHRGYYSGRYENARYGNNVAVNVNTNAIILESLLYRLHQGKPLAQPR